MLKSIQRQDLGTASSGDSRIKDGGGRGIRTHETFLFTGFQDQLHRPLGQTSVKKFTVH